MKKNVTERLNKIMSEVVYNEKFTYVAYLSKNDMKELEKEFAGLHVNHFLSHKGIVKIEKSATDHTSTLHILHNDHRFGMAIIR